MALRAQLGQADARLGRRPRDLIRLVASDLDGTLVRSDGTVSERTVAAVRGLDARGIEFVVATARGPRGIKQLAVDAGLRGSAICSNGAALVDLETGTIRRIQPLGSDVALRLVHALRARLPGILFAVEHETFAHEPGFAAWDWQPPPGTRVADAVELVNDPVAKLVLRHEAHALEVIAEAARDLARDEASVTIPGQWTVEISAAGVSKAAALAELCDELGIAAADVLALGDYPNDLPMLAWAGRGVAVANAHPDVLAAADELTASNDEDGVALVLESL